MTNLAINLSDARDALPAQASPLLAAITRLAGALVFTHAERTLRNELEARPDRLLADIGITRGDIPAFARHAVRGHLSPWKRATQL